MPSNQVREIVFFAITITKGFPIRFRIQYLLIITTRSTAINATIQSRQKRRFLSLTSKKQSKTFFVSNTVSFQKKKNISLTALFTKLLLSKAYNFLFFAFKKQSNSL